MQVEMHVTMCEYGLNKLMVVTLALQMPFPSVFGKYITRKDGSLKSFHAGSISPMYLYLLST